MIVEEGWRGGMHFYILEDVFVLYMGTSHLIIDMHSKL